MAVAAPPVRPAATPQRPVPPIAVGRTPPAGAVRLTAFAGLCLFSSLQWSTQVAPAQRGAAAWWTLLAVAAGAALIGARQLPRRAGAALVVGVVLVAIPLLLLAAGAPGALLRPRGWSELAPGLGQGLQALPDVRVPYRGVDEWVRTVILAGGGLLALAAAALAFWPARGGRGHPVAATAVLGAMYAVAVVVNGPDHPFAGGAALAILAAALLWADRLAPAQVPVACALVAGAVLAALLLAPRVDASRPWIDPRHLADGLSASSSVRFDWSHRYTPLDWPRDGREALRVKASASAYWKGVTLERFDGVHWRQDGPPAPADSDTEMTVNHPEWRREVRVVARDISSRQLYAPGDVIAVTGLGRDTEASTGGTRVIPAVERALKPGDSYRAEVYVPTPSVAEMQAAGSYYPLWMRNQTSVELPPSVGGPAMAALGQPSGSSDAPVLSVPFFGVGGPIPIAPHGSPYIYNTGRSALLRSDYAPVYRLARRLAAGAATPYEVVRRVLRRVRGGARYTESPPPARLPLVDFLFGHKLGYCQQFSGAMTLLLRLDGIPARVAEGFAPGVFDRGRGEYVVRDFDAHSWVEVYFPRLGWVAFDPTPSSAPPASQASDRAPSAAAGDSTDRGGDKPSERRGTAAGAQTGGDRTRLWLGLAFTALCGLAVLLAVRGRRRGPQAPDVAPELAELRRALARTGRAPATTTTLQAIETGFAGDAGAQGYVRALRLRRYGAGTAPPTPAQRAALRSALAAGLGPLGRLRAWAALPPRAAELRAGRLPGGLRKRS